MNMLSLSRLRIIPKVIGFSMPVIMTCFFLLHTAYSLDLDALIENQIEAQKSENNDIADKSVPLDVDSNSYMVGPGDGFEIHVKELPSQMFRSTINATGSIFIDEFGEIPVSKLLLTQAYDAIRQKIRTSLKKDYHVYVTLRQIKSLSISIVGPVANPGTIQLKGNVRMLDAIKTANQGKNLSLGTANLREIKIRNGESTRVVDLIEFLKTNDFRQNPYVFTGDQIQIPLTSSSVTVGGQILWPSVRRLPIHNGEPISKVLDLLVLKSTADTDFVIVSRSTGTNKIARSEAEGFPLQDNDVIVVSTRQRVANVDTALVSGEVIRPGTIVIQNGKTTVAEALEMAGGVAPNGDLGRAYILRRAKIAASHFEGDSGRENVTSPSKKIITVVRPEMNSSMENLLSSNDYAVLPVKADGHNVILEERDELYVPRNENFVYISGQVDHPGAYPFQQGWNVEDYVRKAGGYTSKADSRNSYIVTYYHEAYQIKGRGAMQSGDIIVIPTSVEYKRFTSIFLPTTQLVISILSLALSIAVLTGVQF